MIYKLADARMLIIFCEKYYIHVLTCILKMKKAIYSIIFVTFFSACGNSGNRGTNSNNHAPISKLATLGWITGEWYMDSPEGRLLEVWQKVSDTLLSGYSIMLSGKGDTLFSETMKLVQRRDTLWYIPTVSDQNNGQEVPFKEKAYSASEVIFENPMHDFPQRIIYRKGSDSTLFARIEGKKAGAEKGEDFPYKRLK